MRGLYHVPYLWWKKKTPAPSSCSSASVLFLPNLLLWVSAQQLLRPGRYPELTWVFAATWRIPTCPSASSLRWCLWSDAFSNPVKSHWGAQRFLHMATYIQPSADFMVAVELMSCQLGRWKAEMLSNSHWSTWCVSLVLHAWSYIWYFSTLTHFYDTLTYDAAWLAGDLQYCILSLLSEEIMFKSLWNTFLRHRQRAKQHSLAHDGNWSSACEMKRDAVTLVTFRGNLEDGW